MATKKSGPQPTKSRAKEVAGGKMVRDRVRELSVAAFRDRNLTLNDVSQVVQDVLSGAVESVDQSIPSSSRNVLREVFDGLSEGVHAVAKAGSTVVAETRKRGKTLPTKEVTVAVKRMKSADADFLSAVANFASKASKEVRKELESLVAGAKQAGPQVAGSVRKSAQAANGRLLELTQESARAGVRVARRAAGGLAMGAGGLLEGLAEAITPKDRPAVKKKPKAVVARTASKKPAKKTKKPATVAKRKA